MKNLPSWVGPVVIGVLLLSTGAAALGMVRSLGRISVMEVEADTAAAVTARAIDSTTAALAREAVALMGEIEARADLATSFAEAAQERADAVLREAEARAILIVQEAEGEAAFRRLTGYLESKDDLLGVRLAEEMDAEFRVQGMLADAALDVSASSLLISQARNIDFVLLVARQDSAREVTLLSHAATLATHTTTVASFQVELSIQAQIINEYENLATPSFFRKILDLPEVAAAGIVVGSGLTYFALR